MATSAGEATRPRTRVLVGYLPYDLTDGRLGQTRQPSSGRINELSQSTELAAQVEQDEMVPGRVISQAGRASGQRARSLSSRSSSQLLPSASRRERPSRLHVPQTDSPPSLAPCLVPTAPVPSSHPSSIQSVCFPPTSFEPESLCDTTPTLRRPDRPTCSELRATTVGGFSSVQLLSSPLPAPMSHYVNDNRSMQNTPRCRTSRPSRSFRADWICCRS